MEAPLAADPGPQDEPLYQQARQELTAPKPVQTSGLISIALFLFFVVGQFTDMKSPEGIVLLLLVLVFHEAGHALGMRLFGFKDVRMFFIPFFGAAVSGRSRGVAAWKEAVVSLLGPLPGIVLAIVLFWVMLRRPSSFAISFVEMLLLVNLFNLLPFGFLDGGRFLERVLFSRHRVLEVGFQAIGCVLLALIAAKLSAFILGFFALYSLTRLPRRWRTLKVAAGLRQQFPTLNADPDGLGDTEGRAVFAAARGLSSGPASERPAIIALTMQAILDGTKRAPGVLASLGLLFLYFLGLVFATIGAYYVTTQNGPPNWQTFEQVRWRAEFPREPAHRGPDAAGAETWQAVVSGTERFTIVVATGGDDDGWIDRETARLAAETDLKLSHTGDVVVSGQRGREVELAAPGRVLRSRFVAAAGRRYQVTASAPRWGENQRRFLESFALVEANAAP